jgi:hypothetical protein
MDQRAAQLVTAQKSQSEAIAGIEKAKHTR